MLRVPPRRIARVDRLLILHPRRPSRRLPKAGSGAGPWSRTSTSRSQWIQAVRAGRPMRILGSPDRTRDLTDVGDVVTGLLRLADRNVQGTVNLGTGTGRRLATIAQVIAAVLGRPADLVVEAADPEDVADTLADTGRCQALLGMTPRTDLDALVRRQVAAALRALPDGHGVPSPTLPWSAVTREHRLRSEGHGICTGQRRHHTA
jgi:hypothetical protein